MPWRGEKKVGDGDGDGGLGLGAAWQEKAENNGKHVLGRARSHGNGEGDSVFSAAAAAVAAIRSDGDVVAFPNNVTGVALTKSGKEACAKGETNKERCAEVEVGTDGRRGAGDAAVRPRSPPATPTFSLLTPSVSSPTPTFLPPDSLCLLPDAHFLPLDSLCLLPDALFLLRDALCLLRNAHCFFPSVFPVPPPTRQVTSHLTPRHSHSTCSPLNSLLEV
ncbi:unnamed protein product, partial [Closterium sp. NIES-53]